MGARPEHPKPLPTDLPNLALVTTHPPPENKGTSLSGGTPSGPLGRQSLAPEIPTPTFLGPSLPCASWQPKSQRGSQVTQVPSPLALDVLPGNARAQRTSSPGVLGRLVSTGQALHTSHQAGGGPAPTLHLGELQLVL